MRSLKTWFIITHTLPIIIVLPVIALVLIYLLETQVILANLSDEVEQQAILTAQIAAGQPTIWQDTAQAQIFVTRFSASNRSEINLFDPSGNLIASNDPADSEQIGLPTELPNMALALTGQNLVQANHSFDLQAEVIEVLYPIPGPNQEIVGVIRLTRELSSVYDSFLNLRYFIIGVTLIALIAAVGLALILALKLDRSLGQVSNAIYGVATAHGWVTLPEKGPKEIRQVLQAFNTLINRLRDLEDSRRRLLANLVHEVGRPIGAVQAAIQALLGGADGDVELRRELLEGMEAQVERLHPLLDNLAKLHERVLGTLELKRQPVNLNEWLPPTVISWREAAHNKGLYWQIELEENIPVLDVDPDRLAQVMGNLLSNAIKYTKEGGTVSVNAGVKDESAFIQISDTGPGLTEEEQANIFEPFYRSNRHRRFPQGMGLGLTIAHDLVTAHGGKLTVESQPGRGSQFTVWLSTNT
jgi:signal transduction histidine kinase